MFWRWIHERNQCHEGIPSSFACPRGICNRRRGYKRSSDGHSRPPNEHGGQLSGLWRAVPAYPQPISSAVDGPSCRRPDHEVGGHGADVFARYIVGWRVSRTAHTSFVLDALEQALLKRRPRQGGIFPRIKAAAIQKAQPPQARHTGYPDTGLSAMISASMIGLSKRARIRTKYAGNKRSDCYVKISNAFCRHETGSSTMQHSLII